MSSIQKRPKKSRPRKIKSTSLPFRLGYGTSSTAVVSSCPSIGDEDGTSSSSTPTPLSFHPSQVASSTPNVVGDNISPIHLADNEASERKWSSKIWEEYNLYDGKCFEDGEPRAICKFCKEGPIFAASKFGTSNFIRHHTECEAHIRSLQELSHASSVVSFNMALYKEKVALSIIRHAYPFTFVEHEANRDLHLFLNPNFKPICRQTAKNYVMKIHEREKEKMRDLLHRVRGRICLTSDMWTSFMGDCFISMTAHFIDNDWKLQAKILDFCHVDPPHSAIVIHDRLLGLLTSWGVEGKVFSITLDNARCNDNMQVILAQSLSLHKPLLCDGAYFHVRCSAHILNLVVQDGLLVIDDALVKVRQLVKYVTGSEGRILKFRETALYAGIDCSKKLCLDCCTRWNSTFKMLNRALIYRDAFLRSMERADSSFPTLLTDVEWTRVEKMCALLEPFDHLTTLISGRNYPTANLYLSSIWKIEMLLLRYCSSDDDFLRDMALKMKVKFDKYWENYSLSLSFAAMLDPRYKFQLIQHYFKELDHVTFQMKSQHVKASLYSLFEEYKKNDGLTFGRNASGNGDCHGEDIEGLDCFDLDQNKSELDAYLASPRLKSVESFNVLTWWEKNEYVYPLVSRMARDILAIPITTVASESAFSIGSRVITKWRSSLDPDTADALMSTRSWLFGFDVEEDDEKVNGVEFDISRARVNN